MLETKAQQDKIKIIVLGPKDIDKNAIAKELVFINESYDICPMFDSDIQLNGKTTDNFEYYMSGSDVELGYKNNSFIYINTYSEFSKGVTIQDFYNSTILTLDFVDFNSISENIFKTVFDQSILVIVDSKTKHDKTDIQESYYSFERINGNNINYLYYFNEKPEDIAKDIIKFINILKAGDDEKINEFLESKF